MKTVNDPEHEGAGPAITPRTRARARHILDHYYIGPARDDRVLEIWGYTDRYTYRPGDTVDLRVSTTAPNWSLEVGRDGVNYAPVMHVADLPGLHQDTPEHCSVYGCDWEVSHSFTIPDDWTAGAYLITLRAERQGDAVEEHHLIFVRRAAQAEPAAMVLVCATGTWLAYNCWGGSSAYEGITGPERNAFSPILSNQRPWTRGFCKLPAGAPRALTEKPTDPEGMVRYAYMEWAYAYGYSKKYASAGWASYERHFARWAEAEGYEFEIVTQHDLELEPDLLTGHRCAVFVGHDEYWTATMRDRVERFTEGGGRVARFAGNFLWQTRLEDQAQTQICYKYTAKDADPFMGSDEKHLVTGAWDAPPVNRPGAQTFGVNGLKGIYAGLGNCVGQGSGGFTVYRPDHWAMKGVRLGYGDQLGAESKVFGYEVDGVDFCFDDGLPFPTGKDGTDKSVEIIALGMATNVEADFSHWGETLYIGSADAEFKALILFGERKEEALDKSSRGNGAIVSWKSGDGEVFCAGTCEWVAGLARRDTQVETITRNVLNRFCR
ncbi:N,N-dimethylformamidase beta subunit family domain-containing protein [Ruegeria sp. SCP11]|uniref:N,N-dimethylformamidase beta subunit family domain-containing protein n=1 Tax=Ruegeria sp. SCP11 TaxID=3141378 RepID=UPI00333B2BEB